MGLFGSKTGQRRSTVGGTASKKATATEPAILRLGWLGVKVADVMAESAFLEGVLGLKYRDEGNSAHGHHVRYDCGLELELVGGGTTWATRPKPRLGQPDLPLIPDFHLDNIQSLASRFHEQDIMLTQLFEQGWAASFLFFDPERNLWQASETRTEPASNTETTSRLGTLWLSVEDLPAAISFYRDVLGLPLVDEAVRPRPITLEAEQYQAENPVEFGPALDQSPVLEISNPPPSAGAVFFNEGVRLALSPGGLRLENAAERVWGQDTAFLPGFQTNNLSGFSNRLRAAQVKITGPFPYYHSQSNRNPHQSQPTQAIRFIDPEGHRWQVFE